MKARFAADEFVVAWTQLGTVERIYHKGDRALGGDPGPRQHPEYFLPEAEATTAALDVMEAKWFADEMARGPAEAAAEEAARRPKPPRVYAEHEMMLCIKACGVETHGGRAPASLMLIGTVAAPDNPWVTIAPKNFRSVLPKGAKPEDCMIANSTHDGPEGRRIYEGQFVRQDDVAVFTNPTFFRDPRTARPSGFVNAPRTSGYVVESDSEAK